MRNFVLLLTVCLISVYSCETDKSNVQEPEFTPEYIAQMHNLYLDKFYAEFIPTTRSDNYVLEINSLIDFLANLPESDGITVEEIVDIKEFFHSFQYDENLETDIQSQFLDFLIDKFNLVLGLDFELDDFVTIYARSNNDDIINKRLDDFNIQILLEVSMASEEFWTEKGVIQSRGKSETGTILADAVGSVVGSASVGIWGSLIGAVASIVYNEVSEMEGSSFDGKVHTPKDC